MDDFEKKYGFSKETWDKVFAGIKAAQAKILEERKKTIDRWVIEKDKEKINLEE